MPYPRAHLVSDERPGYYHLISRCVRSAFLTGIFHGKDYRHRKQWIVDRIHQLAPAYALDVHGYAVLSNHFHLAVHYDPLQGQSWTDDEVVARWLQAYPPRIADDEDPVAVLAYHREQLLRRPALVAKRRRQLSSLSHFMQHLKQPIAVRANREDDCKGHFFEGRFYSSELTDLKAVIAVLAYIDLNPARAGIARRLADCELTAIEARIRAAEAEPAHWDEPMAPVVSGLKRPSTVPMTLRAHCTT